MSIELFLQKIINDTNFKPSLENYIMFPLAELPKLIKLLESGKNITINRPVNDSTKYIKNHIYSSDTGFFLKIEDVQNSNEPQLTQYNDMCIVTLSPYDKIADDDKNSSIIIKSELDKCNNIWVSTDYHLKIYDSKKGISNNENSNTLIDNQNKYVNDNDVFIYLGDIVDGEFSNKESLKNEIDKLNGKKILVKGNNDVLPDEYYKECGFIEVVDSFRYKNIIFSHAPLHESQFNGAKYNIHGHIHGSRKYFIPYHNHIDAYHELHNGNPVTIDELFKNFKSGLYIPE